MPGKLLLFDIDQTLVNTGGAGLRALSFAFRSVFALPDNTPVALDLAGATDSGILREFASTHAPSSPAPDPDAFFAIYLAALEKELAASSDGHALPGTHALLERILSDGTHLPALLTGNIRAGAVAKIHHFGFSAFFDPDHGAYGDDHHDRNQLGPVALARVAESTGRRFAAGEVVVIGDTPKDIRCAMAIGAVAAGVATGNHSTGALAAAGADIVLPDLADTDHVWSALGLG